MEQTGTKPPNQQQVSWYQGLYREQFGQTISMREARSHLRIVLAHLERAGLDMGNIRAMTRPQWANSRLTMPPEVKQGVEASDSYNKETFDNNIADQENSDGR
jgi:hypothetical protein